MKKLPPSGRIPHILGYPTWKEEKVTRNSTQVLMATSGRITGQRCPFRHGYRKRPSQTRGDGTQSSVVAGLVPAIIGIAIETSQTSCDVTGYSTLRSGGTCAHRSVSSSTGCDETSVGTVQSSVASDFMPDGAQNPNRFSGGESPFSSP